MTMTEFIKKNKWNIIAILIFFGLCIYYVYDKNIVMASDSLLGAIIWLISCLNKKYSYSYAVFILIIRADLWPGAVACIVIGLLILFFYRKKSQNG